MGLFCKHFGSNGAYFRKIRTMLFLAVFLEYLFHECHHVRCQDPTRPGAAQAAAPAAGHTAAAAAVRAFAAGEDQLGVAVLG
jgi:hypothetical protein